MPQRSGDRGSQVEVRRTPLAMALVDEYESREVAEHPFFRRLSGRPVDLGAIWLLMANLGQGISGHFVHWLARTISRSEDKRISCFLAKQLNDELGNGDPQQIHSILLDRFIAGLEPWRPAHTGREALLEPGRKLALSGAKPFLTNEIFEALGALMVGEIFAKKMDHCVGDQIRRQNAISEGDLRWLILHETLEMEHADDSRDLALLVPEKDECQKAAQIGARAQWDALWDFLTDVHKVADRSP